MPNDVNVSYSVDLKQRGRGGWVTYVENGNQLRFPVELLGTPGIGIFVPTVDRWKAYCKKEKAEWAESRREEILERVAQGALELRYPSGQIEFTEQWINLRPRSSRANRLLNWLTIK